MRVLATTAAVVMVTVGWVCCVLAHAGVGSEDKPAEVPPEAVTKMTEFLKKVTQAQRKGLDARMAAVIAQVVKVTGLGPEGVKALEAAAIQAEDAAQADLTAKSLENFTKEYAKVGTASMEQMDHPEFIATLAGANLGVNMGVHYTEATDQPAWTGALSHTLTPGQAAAWAKAASDRKEAVAKEIDGYLDGMSGSYQQMLTEPMNTRSNEIIAGLNLPKERADAINALAKQAVDASLAAWRKGAMETLLKNDDATLKKLLKNRNFYYSTTEEDAPDQQAVWKEGLARLLTDDDRARLQTEHDAHRTRRVGALGQLMVEMLDEKIALTASQRARLEPVAQRLVQLEPKLFADANDNDYYALSPQTFYKAAAGVRPEEVRPILDDIQWKHWQEISQAKYKVSEEDGEMVPANATPTPATPDPAAVAEPEDMEQAVSDFLRAKAVLQQKESGAVMLLQAEDATRVAGLPEPTAARLQTAARGAAGAAAEAVVASMEQNVRMQVQGATAENIQQKLANANRYGFQRADPGDQAVWKTAVSTELNPAQQSAWQEERDARSRYNDTAVAGLLMAEFDRKFTLTPEQWSKLVPAVTKALQDYRSDITRMFSYSNSMPWYLMSYYMFLPLQAVPESDFKALLTPAQWDLWTGSSEYSSSASYWENIRSNHEQRAKVKTKR